MPEELLDFTREDMNILPGAVEAFWKRYAPLSPVLWLARFFDGVLDGLFFQSRQGWAWDKKIIRILNSRTESNLSRMTNPEDRAVAQKVVAIVVELMQWPNDYFYMEDKVRCLIGWDTGDLCEAECLMEIGETYGIPDSIPEDPEKRVIDMTIAEFAGWINTHRTDLAGQERSGEAGAPFPVRR